MGGPRVAALETVASTLDCGRGSGADGGAEAINEREASEVRTGAGKNWTRGGGVAASRVG